MPLDQCVLKRQWEEQIRSHMSAKTEWEADMQTQAAAMTVESQLGDAIDNLNEQIAQSEQNLGINLEQIDRSAFVNQAVGDLLSKQPALSERFSSINSSIEGFHAKLAIGEISLESFGDINATFNSFASELDIHSRNMTTLANAKMLEQFLKLEEQLKEAIRRQNQAIQNSTANAALALGLGRSGNDFIGKPAGVPHPVVVNGYVSYDVDGKFEQFKTEMSNESFNFANLDSILRSLSSKSEVEIESFFQVANLKLQRVYERVMGVGSSEERETRRDLATIGDFGMWAGAAPGSTQSNRDLQQIVGQMDPQDAMRAMGGPFASQFSGMLDGFGELGAASTRPSDIQGGFYVQLQLAQMYQGMQQQNALTRASYVDPFTTTLNQFNPLHLVNQSITNIEVGARVHGHDRGNLEKANIMASLKAPLAAVGSIAVGVGMGTVVAAGWTGLGALIGGLIAGAGALVNVFANSFHADARTGAHSIQTTDQGLTNSFFQVGIGAATGIAVGYASAASANYAAATAASQMGNAGVTYGATLATQAGNQMAMSQLFSYGATGLGIAGTIHGAGAQYDEYGNSAGWSLTEDGLINAGVSAALSYGPSIPGCRANCDLFADSFSQTAANTFIQEYRYTHGHSNNYAGLVTAGPEAFGNLVALSLKNHEAQQYIKDKIIDLIPEGAIPGAPDGQAFAMLAALFEGERRRRGGAADPQASERGRILEDRYYKAYYEMYRSRESGERRFASHEDFQAAVDARFQELSAQIDWAAINAGLSRRQTTTIDPASFQPTATVINGRAAFLLQSVIGPDGKALIKGMYDDGTTFFLEAAGDRPFQIQSGPTARSYFTDDGIAGRQIHDAMKRHEASVVSMANVDRMVADGVPLRGQYYFSHSEGLDRLNAGLRQSVMSALSKHEFGYSGEHSSAGAWGQGAIGFAGGFLDSFGLEGLGHLFEMGALGLQTRGLNWERQQLYGYAAETYRDAGRPLGAVAGYAAMVASVAGVLRGATSRAAIATTVRKSSDDWSHAMFNEARMHGLDGRGLRVVTARGAAESTALTVGVRPSIRIPLNRFTAAERGMIEAKYTMANYRIAAGLETAQVGAGVRYSNHLSRRFVRDTMQPGTPIRQVRIPQGFQVDEFVSRGIGGRQVSGNQHLLWEDVNSALGGYESAALRGLPQGTRIQGWHLEWLR